MRSAKIKSAKKRDLTHAQFFLAYWLPLIIYCAFIFYLSSMSVFPGPVSRIDDRLKHTAEYTILGILVFRLVSNTIYRRHTYLSVVLFCFLYGISDEIHQWFVPTRVCSIKDILFDGFGGIVVVIAAWLKRKLR